MACPFKIPILRKIAKPQYMKIHHIAIWASDLECLKDFYTRNFGMKCGNKYVNSVKNSSSYFLYFSEGGAAIEIMNKPGISESKHCAEVQGLAHFSISSGSKEAVDNITSKLENDGCKVVSFPRTTGDGYYESVIEDPEGNMVELTV